MIDGHIFVGMMMYLEFQLNNGIVLTVWWKNKFGCQNFGYQNWQPLGIGYQNW